MTAKKKKKKLDKKNNNLPLFADQQFWIDTLLLCRVYKYIKLLRMVKLSHFSILVNPPTFRAHTFVTQFNNNIHLFFRLISVAKLLRLARWW